ncbi:efflux RND transporter permease subunit [Haliangium sp.]
MSIRRPVTAAVMNFALIVVGLVAYPNIGVDLFPEVEFPVVTVTTVYPGADPEVIETKVVDKLEEQLNTIGGVEILRSVSLENVGQVIIQFELERDADQAAQDVRDKVSAILAELPDDVDPPVVEKFDIGAAPILSIAVAGNKPLGEVTRFADDVIKANLQKLSGVGSIDLVGGRDREVHVEIDRHRLESYGLTAIDVAQALAAQNLDVPGGRIEVGARELTVKTKGEVDTPDAVGGLVITRFGGAPIRIRDVATVIDDLEEERSASDLNGDTAVSLIVRKQSGANTVEVANKVKAELAELQEQMPEGLRLEMPIDNSEFIEASINSVQFDLLLGAILTVLIIMFFLHDWRATLISAVALPTSVIATIGFINVMGFTFNNMTMLALTLSIGILIDDAIVVIENIHRHLEMGKTPRQAAKEATAEIGLAVMAITASIMAVFLPVATMEGLIGRFFYQFGMTVSFAVAVSLLVSFTLTPMLSSRFLTSNHGQQGRSVLGAPFRALGRVIEVFLSAVDAVYRRTLALALRQRALTLLTATLVFAGSIMLLGVVDKEFLPPEDRGEFKVAFELPSGTSLEATKRFAEELKRDVAKVPGASSLFTTIGGGAQGQVNKGDIHVELVDREQRAYTTEEAMDYTRVLLGDRSPALVALEPVRPISGGGSRPQEVQFNIRGPDLDQLNVAATKLVDAMRESGGYVDLDTTYRGGKPELRVDIDRDRAADLGVPVAAIASTVRMLIAGDKVTEIPLANERVDVRVRMAESQRRGPEDIQGIHVRTATGSLVELNSVAQVQEGEGPAQIERQARQRQITVLANLEGKPLGTAMQEVDRLAEDVIPGELNTDWTGMGDIMAKSFKNMLLALVLAIILVYLILAAQFESFVHPFTIMLSLPLATIGAFGGLYLLGMSFNIFSMIGLIMLMGLVTKNAVLLVDYTNVLRSQGMSKHEALLAAGPVRLRPILMTTAAMIFGMLPVAMAHSLGGEQRAPMAIAVIGGLLTSTLLTLVVVPVVYSLMDRFARQKHGPAEDEAEAHGKVDDTAHAPVT